MKYSLDTSNFLDEISSLKLFIVLFLCIVHLTRPSYLSWLFSETLIELGLSFPFPFSFAFHFTSFLSHL